nr:putative capsid maturation protease [Acipenserid herpesvirus 1]WJJ61028.1 capsid maturation protease [Acipenserid herpesvirus 1]
MSVFHTTDHRVAVAKPGGGYTLYDMINKRTEQRDEVELQGAEAAETVPVYCPQCFQTPADCYQKVVGDIAINGTYLVGTVGLFTDDKSDYKPEAYPQRNHEGDLAVDTLGLYHLSKNSLTNTHHLAPGKALYNHNTDGCVGDVICYWHVHHPAKDLVGFNALVRVDTEPDRYGKVFWDTASEAITGFSWGSLETSEGRLVAELSAVHIPGRKGCFARAVAGAQGVKQALDGLCFGAEPSQTLRAGLFDTTSPTSNVGVNSTVHKFLAHYKKSMDQYLSVNKLVYKHKGNTHIEQYLHKGIDDYKQLYGQTTTDHTVTNRLITANMNTQQPQPQPQMMPSALPLQQHNPYYATSTQNPMMTQFTIQDIMQRVEAKHKKQLELEKKEREQEQHKQELDILKNTVLKLQAKLEETPIATQLPKKAKVEESQPVVEDAVSQRLNQITSYLQKLIEMPQTIPPAAIVQPSQSFQPTPASSSSSASGGSVVVETATTDSVTIPVADYQAMKKLMEDINTKLNSSPTPAQVSVTPITTIEHNSPEATSAVVTANIPLKAGEKRKPTESIDSVFANL